MSVRVPPSRTADGRATISVAYTPKTMYRAFKGSIRRETVPLLGFIGLACGMAVYVGGRTVLYSPDINIGRTGRTQIIPQNQEKADRYIKHRSTMRSLPGPKYIAFEERKD